MLLYFRRCRACFYSVDAGAETSSRHPRCFLDVLLLYLFRAKFNSMDFSERGIELPAFCSLEIRIHHGHFHILSNFHLERLEASLYPLQYHSCIRLSFLSDRIVCFSHTFFFCITNNYIFRDNFDSCGEVLINSSGVF